MNNKTTVKVTYLTYISLCILSVLFYKERVAFCDLAFHMFYLIKDQDYIIQNQRFGAFTTQSIPILGSKLNLSLTTISIAYSLGFSLYYFGIFVLLHKVLKNPRFALILLLLSTLMVADTFYWIQSELPQGLAFMILTFGLITRKPHFSDYNKLELVLLIPLIITVAYFHPLIFIPFSFISIFLFLSAPTYKIDRKILLFSFACFWITYLLKNTLLKVESSYEQGAKSGLENFSTLFPNYFFTRGMGDFIVNIVSPGLLVLFIGINALYVFHKKYKKLVLLNSFVIGYTVLISVTYNKAQLYPYYMENMYLPLSVMIGTAFIFDGLHRLKNYTQTVVIGSICIFSLFNIMGTKGKYTARQDTQRKIMKETANNPRKKLLIDAKSMGGSDFLSNFGFSPFEFWLLSSIETPDDVRSIIIHNDPKQIDYIQYYLNKSFISRMCVINYEELNPLYYNFSDTSHHVYYIPVNN